VQVDLVRLTRGDKMNRFRWTLLALSVVVTGLLFLSPTATEAQSVRWRGIHREKSKRCVDVQGKSKKDKAAVQQAQCKRKNNSNQKWAFVHVGGGYYSIVARHSGKCIDIRGASTGDRALAQQSTCHGGTNQQFAMVQVGRESYQLVARHSGRCLAVQGSSKSKRTPIHQTTCKSSTKQKFEIKGKYQAVSK
jgi:butyrate kinase